jgi:hypothetical protein
MTKQNTITWLVLMVLTVIAGLVSSSSITYLVPVIILLASLKFIGVAFSFMEMKKANLFWKVLILAYLIVFCGVILSIAN